MRRRRGSLSHEPRSVHVSVQSRTHIVCTIITPYARILHVAIHIKRYSTCLYNQSPDFASTVCTLIPADAQIVTAPRLHYTMWSTYVQCITRRDRPSVQYRTCLYNPACHTLQTWMYTCSHRRALNVLCNISHVCTSHHGSFCASIYAQAPIVSAGDVRYV